jgi:pimeloyl-ACP methyl ester carboxylesterase
MPKRSGKNVILRGSRTCRRGIYATLGDTAGSGVSARDFGSAGGAPLPARFSSAVIRHVRAVPEQCPDCASPHLSPEEGWREDLPEIAWERPVCEVQQTLRATNPVGFMQAARFIAEAEMPSLAAGLTMPLLMIQGEEDSVAPAATNAELLAAALPHARLVMLAGCGHLPEVELPSCVNDLIAAHLS